MAAKTALEGETDMDSKEQFARKVKEVKDGSVCDEGKGEEGGDRTDDGGGNKDGDQSEGDSERESEENSEDESEGGSEGDSQGDSENDENMDEDEDGELDYEGSAPPYYGADDDGFWVPDSDYEEGDEETNEDNKENRLPQPNST